VNVLFASDWRDIFDLKIAGWGLDVHLGIVLGAVVIILIGLGAIARHRPGGWQVTSADFTFAGCATVTMCPTDDVAGMAH
jgi:hypothetical protein